MVTPKRARLLLCGFAAGAVALAGAASPAGAGPTDGVVLDLRLDEPAGAKVAQDASGYGHHGTIGSHVRMNGAYADFDRHSPDEDIDYGTDHLIVVPDASGGLLDPGSGSFVVELSFRTTSGFGNLIQKGQSHTVGGQVKIQLPGGRVTCMFRTPQGLATAGSGSRVFNDGQWHDLRCVRTSSSVTLYVDGVRVGRKSGFTGTLDNTWPWTIGGKLECDGVDVSCDYFPGEVAWVRLSRV